MSNRNIKGWLIVIVSFLSMMFIFSTCISCMGLYVKPVCEEFHIMRTQYSLVTTIQSLAMVLSSMIAGKLLDKYNTRLLITAGALFVSLSMFAFALAQSFIVFYIAAIFIGIGISLSTTIAISILINEWFEPSKQSFALGIAFVGSGVGAMILNPFYSFIIQSYGWRYSFGTAGIMIAVIMIPMILIFVKRNRISISDDEYNESVVKTDTYFSLSDALKKPAMWMVFIAYIIIAFTNMAILNHGIAFMTDSGISPAKAAFIISTGSGVLIIGKVIMGIVYGKVGAAKGNLIEVIMLTICFVGFWVNGFVDTAILFIIFVIFYGLGFPISTISMPLVLNNMFKKCDFGAILGFLSMSAGIGGMMQVIISIVYDKAGSYYTAWIATSIACALSFFFFAISVRPQKKLK